MKQNKKTKLKISQVAIAGQDCKGIAVFCANAAINNAKVEQDNDAKQGNVNVQTQTDDSNGPCSGPNCPTTSTVEDPSDPSNTQTAELENEAEQENEAEISQVAIAGQDCNGIAVFCANVAANNAEVEQDNDAEQANVNSQTEWLPLIGLGCYSSIYI